MKIFITLQVATSHGPTDGAGASSAQPASDRSNVAMPSPGPRIPDHILKLLDYREKLAAREEELCG
jgi:hypothetical protein